MDFWGKKNVAIFENSIHFLILCIVLKNETSLPSGGLRPRTPCGGLVMAFKWPGRPPPRKNPGDATEIRDCSNLPVNFVLTLEEGTKIKDTMVLR